MGALIRAYDWSSTPLGEPARWPAGLRTALRIMLTTNHPVFVFWGPEHRGFYNDAYSRSLGPEKHPSILGAPARVSWPETWDIIGPQIEQVMAGQGATWHENQRVPIVRHGRLEEVYWTYSFGPIDDDAAPTGVGGVLVLCTETTAQVFAERRMRDAEARWRKLFDQAPGFMCVLEGPRHRFAYANQRYLSLTGQQDIVGREVREVLPEVERQGFMALLDQAYQTGEAYRACAAPVWLPDGNDAQVLRYLDFVYQPIVDESGEIKGVLVEGSDVTEAKANEVRLRDSESRLRMAIDAAGMFTWESDLVSGTIRWSDNAARVIGCTAEELPRHSVGAMFFVAPEEARRLDGEFARLMAGGETAFSFEFRGRGDATRACRWHTTGRIVYGSAGEPLRIIGTTQDVTTRVRAEEAQRESERRFRVMADDVPVMIWVTDARGRIEFVNRAYHGFFGVSEHELLSAGWEPLLHPEDVSAYVGAYLQSLLERRPFHGRARVRSGSAGWRWIDSTGVPRFTEDGVFLGHVGTSADVNDLIETHQTLREADRRKDEFLAMLSHELRNPLAPIVNCLSVIDRLETLSSTGREAFEMMTRQVRHMAHLVDDLLEINRITRGKIELRPQPLRLDTALKQVVDAAMPSCDAKQQQLTVEVGSAPIELHADPVRITQILENLLSNASKYTPRGGTIRVQAGVLRNAHALATEEVVEIKVSDDGIGIEADHLSDIFELFAQAEPSRGEYQGGLGIGLALVKRLVELHRGAVFAESRGRGQGATFVVRLPTGMPVQGAASL